jgi:hypothetical protein
MMKKSMDKSKIHTALTQKSSAEKNSMITMTKSSLEQREELSVMLQHVQLVEAEPNVERSKMIRTRHHANFGKK